MSSFARWQRTIVDEKGNTFGGARVEVRKENGGGIATIYSDRAGAVPKTNPFNANDEGFAFFHAGGDAYRITVSDPANDNVIAQWRYVGVGLAAERDSVGITVLGVLDAEVDLPVSGEAGDAYIIDGDVWIWNVADEVWDNAGPFVGPAGSPGTGLTWIGDWVTATPYEEGDGVEHNGSAYVCLVAHTSGASTEPGVGVDWEDNWDLFAQAGEDGTIYTHRGAYSALTAYVPDDLVLDQSSTWLCLVNTTGNAPPTLPTTSNTQWQLLAERGPTGATGSTGSTGAAGASPGPTFTFSTTTTMADPGAGAARLNNATLSSVTAAALDASSNASGNPAVRPDLLTWDDSTSTVKGVLRIYEVGSPQNFAVYEVTGVTDNTGWVQLALTYVAHAGSFGASDNLCFSFSRTGDKGDTGNTGLTGDTGATGAAGASPGPTFSHSTTTTMADPGAGASRLNNATLASVTAIALDASSNAAGNPSVRNYWLTWDDSTNTLKGHILYQEVGSPQNFAIFSLQSITDNTGWVQLAVTHIASNGSFSASDNICVTFIRAGDKGADGAGSGDVSGPAGGVVDNEIVVYDSTTGKLIKSSGGTTIASLTASILSTIRNGVSASFDTLSEIINGLASTSASLGASLIGVQDTGGFFAGTTVEAVLQDLGSRVAGLDAAVVLKGTWDASAGTFPGGGTAQAGWSYIVSVGGTVNSVVFAVGDRIIATVDNASTTTFASNWFKADYTDLVSSVAGKTGAVTLATGDIAGVATDRLLGRDTASSGVAEELTVSGGLEFSGSGGIRRSALTGDVTASAGSNATTIANNAVTTAKILDANVTLAKIANIASDRLLGRDTASAGVTEELTVGNGLEFTGSGGIRRSALTGAVAAAAGSNTVTIPIDLEIVLDGGGSVLTTGTKLFIPVSFGFTVTGWTIIADQSGSIVVDIWADTYANAPPTNADSIAGSEKPTLSAAQKNQDLSLTTWTGSGVVAAGSVLGVEIESVTTCTRVTVVLHCTKTS